MERLERILILMMGAPPLLNESFISTFAEPSVISSQPFFPQISFLHPRKDARGQTLPQVISHRGYKAKFAENTMSAFKGAVEVGTQGLETDVHLTRDGVVVLSHDGTLKRCFGLDQKIIDCDWNYIAGLRTLAEPHDSMPRLVDLLEYLNQPGLEHIWLLLDIKLDNNDVAIMRAMAEAVKSVEPAAGTSWKDRIVLGPWAAKFLPLCEDYFPGYSIVNIAFSIPYTRQFLEIDCVGFNVLQTSLVSPFGKKLIRDAHAADRRIMSWTVNDAKHMDWCIRQGLDGVITDDPKMFLDICDAFDESKPAARWSFLALVNLFRVNLFLWMFSFLFWRRFGFGLDKRYIRRAKR